MKLKELKNTVVNTKTQAEYDELMRIYEDAGWVWIDGDKPTTGNVWPVNGQATCVEASTFFDWTDTDFYKEKGYKIITLTEFKEIQGMNKFDFEVGDILIDKDGDKVKVLAICGELCALSDDDDFDNLDYWFTQKKIDDIGLKKYTEPEVIEMTVEEISKALGKTVKVVE